MINELAKEIYGINVKNGFYEDEVELGTRIALIHSEVSEALEADRHKRYCRADPNNLAHKNNADDHFQFNFKELIKDTFEDELADAMIRIMDLAAHMDIDLEGHIKAKMRYNSLRPYKHGKRY